MVAISFSVFKDKILDGTKTQTIRRYKPQRYEQIKRIRKLQLYWHQRRKDSELLREAELEDIFKLNFVWLEDDTKVLTRWDEEKQDWIRCTEEEQKEIWKRDGFSSFDDMIVWFSEHYEEDMWMMCFMVIRWKVKE